LEPAALITAFVTLLVVIDPVGLAPLFVALTPNMDRARRRAIALRATFTGMALLTLFGIFGQSLLDIIGISMPAFRISGGMLLFLIALEMLFERRTKRRAGQASQAEDHPDDDPSIFPLATPLIAGPGAMTTMILLAGQAGSTLQLVAIHLVMIAVVLTVLLFFLAAGLIERALGETGILVVTRLLGMLLAALSVQFVLDGLRGVGLIQALG